MENLGLLINGELVPGEAKLDVINPATGQLFVSVPAASSAQAERAIAAAKAAFPGWRATPAGERQRCVRALADEVKAHASELARALVQEQGKPLQEATSEVLYTELFLRYFANSRLDPERVRDDAGYEIEVLYKPLGVVIGIAPWNLPLLIGCNKIGPAVVTGNTAVLKPAPTTPVTTLMLAQYAQKIFPPGVLNVITDRNNLGGLLTSHPDVAKVSFTGSTATGRKVAASASNSLKRLTLELGGNDAGIVLPDAKVSDIAAKILGGAFMNCGQVCIALKRLYVHESLYEEMCGRLAELAEQMIVGNGLEQGVQIGPLQNSMQMDKARHYLEVGRRDGRIIAGGICPPSHGNFVRPTIVRDIEDGSELVDQEQFAPILPVIKYSKIDEAIERANRSEYGLGGSVWSPDVNRAKTIAARLDSGTIWINHHLHFGPDIPFCGAKQSGLGVEFGQAGVAEFTQRSVVSMAKT